MVKIQFNIRIKAIRSENGLEFTSNKIEDFFKSKGIK